MEIDFPNIDLDKAEKAAKAIGYFWLLGASFLGFLLLHWKGYKDKRPRALIAKQQSEIDALKTLIGELTKGVGANSTNIVSVTDQLQGIVGDADKKIGSIRADQESHFVRVGVYEDLCERVQKLDDRLWQLGDGTDRRSRPRETATGKREGRHDPGDR